MVDAERLARLLRRITDDVHRLRRVEPTAVLDDEVLLDHVKYRFVTAIEACIDVAMHVAATEGLASPDTNADAVRSLGRHGIVASRTADAVGRAVGFRNVLVHRYAEVDDHRVLDHLGGLDHLDAFVDQVTAHYLS